ncbi:MAG: HlyD family efflux transporter periplasmic adaptor subunit [Hyphomicrobiaceae bacterium]|nr:HlyD family efflux transporter periplasmic adaptor subunit [Hyphomicrobiaceae bacterium]
MTIYERGIATDDAQPIEDGEAGHGRNGLPPGSTGDAVRRGRRGLFARLAVVGLQAVLPIAVIAVGIAGYQYLRATRPEAPQRPIVERAFTIAVVEAVPGTYTPTLTLYGQTVAGRQVDIRALVAGRVVATSGELREGGILAAGAPLISIDPLDYQTSLAEAEAQLAEAKGKIAEFEASLAADRSTLDFARRQIELARSDLGRAAPLAERGAVSERTVDDRKQILLQREQVADQLASGIDVWQARIAQQTAVASRLESVIARARQRLADAELAAPFDAVVTEVGAQVGRMLSVNDKVATLIDRNWIEAKFALSDEQFGRITADGRAIEGRPLTVRWILGRTAHAYAASVERVGARVTAEAGGIDVFARIAEPTKPVPLRPGAFVAVEIADVTFENVVKLPSSALNAGRTVFAVVDNRLKGIDVDVVGGTGEDIFVRGDIPVGARIMTTRISTPGDGVLVEIEAQP